MRTLLGRCGLALVFCAAGYAGLHSIGSALERNDPTALPDLSSAGCTEAILLRSAGRTLLSACPPAREGTVTHTAELP